MPERRSDKPGPGKLRFRAVFTADALSADALEAAGRLFARWVARGSAASNREALDPALGLASGLGRENAHGTAPARHVGSESRTERTHST
jgi:hypothetical protein